MDFEFPPFLPALSTSGKQVVAAVEVARFTALISVLKDKAHTHLSWKMAVL